MKFYRFAADGRYLNFIVQDRPMDEYGTRLDLTADAPPVHEVGLWPYREAGAWVLRDEDEIGGVGAVVTS